MNNTFESETCGVCVETMNKSTRMKIECVGRDYTVCKMCYKTFFLDLNDNPHCMNCKKVWNYTTMIEKFDKSFVTTTYKHHREKVLEDREMSKLVETQPIIEKLIERNNLKNEIKVMEDEVEELKNKIFEARYKMRNQNNKVERKLFVRKCMSSDCRGFLSSQWKCGICCNWSCPDCHVVLGQTKGMDGDVEHVCNADSLATAKLLSSDTKHCPKCSVGIFKIDGCDMMFCTECHTSFSWKTGIIITGTLWPY